MHLKRFALTLIALHSYLALASDIAVPKNDEWLTQVDLSLVPNLPVRPVGSGTCKAAKCDGSDNDKCFETCGNKAIPSDMYGCPRPLEWALTFDDGPSQYTGELLDYLDSLGIKATFCVMGSNVKQYPQFVKRAHESGHLIASHTYSHPHLMSLTNEQIINEIKATEEAVFDVTGFRPSYVRPPYGEADERVKALLKTMGYKILMWNVDPTDYDVYSLPFGGDMIQSAFRKAADGKDTGLNALNDPGYISLQHDLYKESVQQVPEVVKYLTSKGYRFVTVAECTKEEDSRSLNTTTSSTHLSPSASQSTSFYPSSSSSVQTSVKDAIDADVNIPASSLASRHSPLSIITGIGLAFITTVYASALC